ncbi:MAG TPA: RluA family pseudouridine synthase [Burkholderiaceae bacterium]|nr:RluA family pseudouridine synthase [Burkholderiaceae bacterium]
MQQQTADYIERDCDPDEPEPLDSPLAALQLSARDGAGERIDRFVAAQLPQYSRTRIQRWLELGAVLVDGRTVLRKHRLAGHERIDVVPQPTEAEQAFEADPVPLAIVHEDADLMIVDKPAGLVTHPAPGNWRGTLLNGLLHARPDSARLPRAGIVHRLDKDTSGLMLVARSERGFERLVAALAARRIGRRYLALAHGALERDGAIDAPIGRDPRERLRMAVVDAARGKSARTLYRALGAGRAPAQSGGAPQRLPVTLIECTLETGRTHQIRVHLASIGHPLVGDATYGGAAVAGFARQALHAWRLTLPHPVHEAVIDLRTPPPPDFAALVAGCGLAPTLAAFVEAAS